MHIISINGVVEHQWNNIKNYIIHTEGITMTELDPYNKYKWSCWTSIKSIKNIIIQTEGLTMTKLDAYIISINGVVEYQWKNIKNFIIYADAITMAELDVKVSINWMNKHQIKNSKSIMTNNDLIITCNKKHMQTKQFLYSFLCI